MIDGMIRSLEMELAGSGTILLSGKADVMTLRQSGVSRVKAFEFQTENRFVDSSGRGCAEITVKNSLEVMAHGLSKIRYVTSHHVLDILAQ